MHIGSLSEVENNCNTQNENLSGGYGVVVDRKQRKSRVAGNLPHGFGVLR
jgi:hypothetical protein